MAKILVNATHGNEDAERATLPFVVGNVSATADQETVVLLTIEGVRLATRGYADDIHKDGFAPLTDVIRQFLDTVVSSGRAEPAPNPVGLARRTSSPAQNS